MEANSEHDFRLKRLIGMLRTIEKQNKFCTQIFVSFAKRHCRTDLLTPESYMEKNAKRCCRLAFFMPES